MLKISRNRITESSCGLEEADYFFKDWSDLSDELFYSSQVSMSPSTSAVSSSWSFVPSPLATAALNGAESISPDIITATGRDDSKPQLSLYNQHHQQYYQQQQHQQQQHQQQQQQHQQHQQQQQHQQHQQQKSNCCTTIEEVVEEDEFEIIKHNDNRKRSTPTIESYFQNSRHCNKESKSSQFVIVLDEASIKRYSSLFDSIQDCGHVDGCTVKTIWNKSCLPKEILYQIWHECEPVNGLLDRDSFIIGMGKIDTILEQYKSYNLLL